MTIYSQFRKILSAHKSSSDEIAIFFHEYNIDNSDLFKFAVHNYSVSKQEAKPVLDFEINKENYLKRSELEDIVVNKHCS